MRSKLLERELVNPEEVYALAEVLERSRRETQQFDQTKIQKTGMAESQKETEVGPVASKEVYAAKGGKKSSKLGIGKASFGGLANREMMCYRSRGWGHMKAHCPYSLGGGGGEKN